MNLLAHALLATPTVESIVGNFAADFIPVREVDMLPEGIRRGVMQHRHIDGFTDRHAIVQHSIQCLSTKWGWFSGIIIDVYYDHLLSIAWDQYCKIPLYEFVELIHKALNSCMPSLPETTQRTMQWFIENNQLMNYARLDGIESALAGISRRIAQRIPQRAVDLSLAMSDLHDAHPILMQHFHRFFPQVQEYTRIWDGV